MSEGSCLFCRIARKEIPAKIVFEDDDFVAFEDTKPQAPVHILVIPKRHVEKVSDLKEDDIDLAGRLLLFAVKLARGKQVQEPGYRLVFNCNRDAGQAVFHLHLHLLGGRKFGWPPG